MTSTAPPVATSLALDPLAVRAAQRTAAARPAAARTAALRRLAALLGEEETAILAANRADLAAAEQEGLAPALRGRLGLSRAKLDVLRDGALQLAADDDPIGAVLRRTELDEGLVLEQVRAPLGVLLVIFESRPDAAVQIGALAMRSGNGLILKGGSEARESNRVLVGLMRRALADADLPADLVTHVEGREAVAALLRRDDAIDLVIPRGSGELVRTIQQSTRIPVLGHAEGVCHLYLDAAADLAMAARLAVDGKCDYPSACNATETLLVHRDLLPRLGPVLDALEAAGVTLRGDAEVRATRPGMAAAGEDDWRTEYGDLVLSVGVVADRDAAIDHVHRYGSAHTEAIVTEDAAAAEDFLRRVDAASVFWNASTRFADGYRYGLGAEVGIATGRVHARGPVGVEGLLTTRWLLRGHGQAVADYGAGGRRFTHRDLGVA